MDKRIKKFNNPIIKLLLSHINISFFIFIHYHIDYYKSNHNLERVVLLENLLKYFICRDV